MCTRREVSSCRRQRPNQARKNGIRPALMLYLRRRYAWMHATGSAAVHTTHSLVVGVPTASLLPPLPSTDRPHRSTAMLAMPKASRLECRRMAAACRGVMEGVEGGERGIAPCLWLLPFRVRSVKRRLGAQSATVRPATVSGRRSSSRSLLAARRPPPAARRPLPCLKCHALGEKECPGDHLLPPFFFVTLQPYQGPRDYPTK